MQEIINIAGLLFFGAVILSAVLPEQEEKQSNTITILKTRETK